MHAVNKKEITTSNVPEYKGWHAWRVHLQGENQHQVDLHHSLWSKHGKRRYPSEAQMLSALLTY